MIYVETTITLVFGKMADYQAIVTKEVLPVWDRLGIKLVASWRTTMPNVSDTVALFAYEDMAQMQKQVAARNQDKEYRAAMQKIAPLVVSSTSRILEPHPWSALK